ncbi:MAG: glycosyltransferase family 2 protein [Candidatus Schekmanbacteria bacterium]|nr:glycosyltransferase family 2 protein [Candidatus Schekmanbacteria bacterium]
MLVSVVVPIYNEEETIPFLYKELKEALENLGYPYEIILVDDGSWDKSFICLKELAIKDKTLKLIRFRRNYGQTAAMSAGFDHARGDYIVTVDGDLQNDPRDIKKMLEKAQEGYEIVSGWRIKRQDTFITRKLPSMIANRIISKLTAVRLHDYGCTLKVYKKEVVKNLHLYGEAHRFIPALASWMGVKVTEMPVNHRPRKYGKSKYGLIRTVKVILDLINVKFLLSYSTRPIQVFGSFGLVSLLLSLLSLGGLVYMKIAENADMTGNPLLFLFILCVLVGVQFITMGLLGEINIRTYHEIQNKPIYTIAEIVETP